MEGVVLRMLSSSLNTGHLRLMRSIRLARALRSMRVLRLFRYVTALRTLVLSIMSTMGSLFWTLALLIILFYSFGLAAWHDVRGESYPRWLRSLWWTTAASLPWIVEWALFQLALSCWTNIGPVCPRAPWQSYSKKGLTSLYKFSLSECT